MDSRPALLLVVLLALVGCGSDRDLHVERWPNDRLREQGPQKPDPDGNGVRYGHWRTWFDTGQLESEGDYHAGQRHGDWTFWHANGAKYQQGRYGRGQRVGEWSEWREDGSLLSQGGYRDGKKDGRWRQYDERGRLRYEGWYKDGLPITR